MQRTLTPGVGVNALVALVERGVALLVPGINVVKIRESSALVPSRQAREGGGCFSR